MSDSPVGPEDIRAAAETFRELGPDYHDAVIASFIDRIDREVDARVQARLAELAAPPPPRRRMAWLRDRPLRTSLVGAAAALAVLVVGAGAAAVGSHGGAVVRSAQPAPRLPGKEIFIRGQVISGPNGTKVQLPRRVIHPPAPPAPAPPN